jgi:hypothetical protein
MSGNEKTNSAYWTKMATKYLLYNPQADKERRLVYKIKDKFYTASGLKCVYDPEMEYIYGKMDESNYIKITSFIVIYDIATHCVFIKTKTQWGILAINNNEIPEFKLSSFDLGACPENFIKSRERGVQKFYQEPIEFVEALRIPDPIAEDTKLMYYPSAYVRPFPLYPYLNLKILAEQGKRVTEIPDEILIEQVDAFSIPSTPVMLPAGTTQTSEDRARLEAKFKSKYAEYLDSDSDSEDKILKKEENSNYSLQVIPFINETYMTLDKSFVIKMTENMIVEFQGVAVKSDNGKYTGEIRKATEEEKEEVTKLGIAIN